MRFLGQFLIACCLCCMLATPVFAAVFIDNVTLDGATQVNVAPLANISVQVTGRTTNTGGGGGANWRSLSWSIDSEPPNCENFFNYSSAGIHIPSPFNIPAPSNNGTYSVTFTAYRNNNCGSGASTPYPMANAITVSSTNAAPVITSAASINAAENQTTVTTVTATDADGDIPTFSISGGADQGLLSLTAAGVLTFDSAPDFEIYADFNSDGVYEVEVTANDGNSGTDVQTILVTVTNLNEAPTLVTLSNSNVDENTDTSGGTTVGSLTTTDQDAGDTATYSINGGADAAVFSINGSDLVLTDGILDFETQASYTVTVQVSDTAGLTHNQTFTININDLNEAPTLITLSNSSVDENTDTSGGTTVGSLTTTDQDADDTATYSINGGADAALFSISGSDLVLTDGILDFETQASYAVTVQVSDTAGLTHNQTFTINVNGLNEAPTIDSTAVLTATENVAYSYNITTSDPDAGATLIITDIILPAWLTLTDHGDSTATLNGTPTNLDVGDHNMSFQVSDGSLTATQIFTITVGGGISEVNYQFDEMFWTGSVGEVQDSSGDNFHATATNGPTTAAVSPAIPGNPGTCNYGVFDGVDDYIALPSTYPDLTADYTITAWIRTTDNTRSGQRILIDDPNNTQGFGLSLGDGAPGQVRFFSRSTSPIFLDTPNVVANNTWYFVAAVADITNNTKRIYVYDQAGTQLAAVSDTYTGSWGGDAGDASMGGENSSSGETGPNFHFRGNLDEIRVHRGALTAAQISTIQNAARMCVYPIAEYRFEGCDWTTGAVVPDELGNHNGQVVQGAHTAPGINYGGGLCNVANLQNEGTDFNRYISLAANPIPLNTDWTLMMWINFPPGFDQHFQYAGYRYSVIAGGTHDLAWIREHSTTGARYWGASSDPNTHLAPFPSSLVGWHHLAFVGNGADTDLYVDGAYYNSVDYKQTGSYTRMGTTADAVNTNGRQNLDTQLDELKFYDGVLSSVEISNIYNLENSGLRWDGSPLNCELCGIVDHYRIEHTGIGLTCQRSDITFRACSNADCSTEYAYPATVTLNPATANPPTWTGGDTQTFTGHQDFQLRQTLPATLSLGLTNPDHVPTNGTKCYDSGVEGDCDIEFYDSGFIFDVPDLTSCQTSPSVSIQAVRTDNTSQTCVADGGFASTNKSLNFWSTYDSPATGTEQVSLSGTNVATSSPGTGVSLNFDATATAIFTVNYPDAGQMQLNARYDGVGAEEAGLVMLGADSFIVRPVSLCVYSDDANADCASGSGSCSAFRKVDEVFNLKVKGVCWESAGDTDYCSGNSTTQNFQLNSIPINHSLIEPSSAGVSAGNIGVTSIDIAAADNGEHVISNQTVSEVGVYTFTATPPDYFGASLPVATSVNIGRFTPDHFVSSITNNGIFQDGCTGFTYSGQTFSYDPPDFPEMLITATGSAGNTTVNYRDDFVKLTNPATQISMPAVTADSSHTGALASPLALTWAPAASSLLPNNDGTLNFSLGADQITYTREANALVAPFTTDVQLSVTAIVDSDGIAATGLPSSFSPMGTEIRYGQMQLQNAYGPETLPLTIPVLTEYYDGSQFVLNSLDSCTNYDFNNLTLSNYQGNLIAGDTVASGSGTLLSGIGSTLSLSAPGVGHDGSVDLMLDLSQATGSDMEWLQPGGNNPTAKATFGIFKGNQRLIYMRESIW